MREIRFRVWDTVEKRFFEPIYEAYKGNLSELLIGMGGQVLHRTISGISIVEHQESRWIVNQHTGLKDKNGKEIYEGDILQDGKGGLGEVEYRQPQFVVWADEKHYALAEGKINMTQLEYTEIVGNIFEDKHLLNGK